MRPISAGRFFPLQTQPIRLDLRTPGTNSNRHETTQPTAAAFPHQGTPPLPRVLSFLYDNYLGDLHDDGAKGDRVANDGSYATTVFASREELAAINTYNAQFPANQREAPVFRGRTVTGTVPSSFIDLQKFQEGEPVQIYPFHAGVRSASSGLAGRTGGGIIPVIDPEKSLLIRDLSMVEDPTRTFDPCTGVGWFSRLGSSTGQKSGEGATPPPVSCREPPGRL